MSCPPPDAYDEELPDDDDSLPDEDDETSDPPEPHGPFTRENPLTFIVPEPLLLRMKGTLLLNARAPRPATSPWRSRARGRRKCCSRSTRTPRNS